MNVIDIYLDQDTVKRTQLVPDEKWDEPDWSDNKIEKNETNAIKDAHVRQISDPRSESRLVKIEGQCRPIPGTEE